MFASAHGGRSAAVSTRASGRRSEAAQEVAVAGPAAATRPAPLKTRASGHGRHGRGEREGRDDGARGGVDDMTRSTRTLIALALLAGLGALSAFALGATTDESGVEQDTGGVQGARRGSHRDRAPHDPHRPARAPPPSAPPLVAGGVRAAAVVVVVVARRSSGSSAASSSGAAAVAAGTADLHPDVRVREHALERRWVRHQLRRQRLRRKQLRVVVGQLSAPCEHALERRRLGRVVGLLARRGR